MKEIEMRPLYAIADDIHAANVSAPGNNWYWCAAPYVTALCNLETINDRYGMDDGHMTVAYLLSNLRGWRGEQARSVKAELQAHAKGGR